MDFIIIMELNGYHNEIPYQATQIEVNEGIIDDKFVSPLTLESKLLECEKRKEFIAEQNKVNFNLIDNIKKIISLSRNGADLTENCYTFANNILIYNPLLNGNQNLQSGDLIIIK